MVDDLNLCYYTSCMRQFNFHTWDEVVNQADTPENHRDLPRRLGACIKNRKRLEGRRIPYLDNMLALCNAMGYDIMLVEKGKRNE